MVYTDAPRNQDDFQETMREKIRNVLRICHIRGHDGLILGAWDCGHRGGEEMLERNAKRSCEVVSLFYELLIERGDTANVFRRVTFAIPFMASSEMFAVFSPGAPCATVVIKNSVIFNGSGASHTAHREVLGSVCVAEPLLRIVLRGSRRGTVVKTR